MVTDLSIPATRIVSTILSNLSISLSGESLHALSEIIIRHELPKGHLLLREDSVCNHIYFIEKGLTRTYYVKDGKEITDCISSENGFACSVMSFLARTPGKRKIQVLEPSVLWSISYSDLQELYSQYHELEHFGRSMAEFCVIEMQKRFDELYFSSALHRYRKLMEQTPSLLLRVPLGIIASYLGISQETLSRVRTQI